MKLDHFTAGTLTCLFKLCVYVEEGGGESGWEKWGIK